MNLRLPIKSLFKKKKTKQGTSLAVQWLRTLPSDTQGEGPGQGVKVSRASEPKNTKSKPVAVL